MAEDNRQIKTVDEYIAKASKPAQEMMTQIRAAIKFASPQAKETISYRMPFYEYKFPGYRGRLVYFAAFKDHVSMFIVPRRVPAAIAKQLKRYRAAKATLQFPLGTRIPIPLIKKLVKLRMKEIDVGD